jgi:serine/threonine-protein kinase
VIPLTLSQRYTIVREIGRGGMASVFLADDPKHGRQVAVKVLLPELSAAIGAERFAREIRLVARLQHPHILPLYDSGEADGLLFFVMPYVEGESLRQRLMRSGPLSLAETTGIVRQIADALDYAHAHDVIHRDLKPENILVSGGQALLADFGVARSGSDVGGGTLTGVGVTLGTPAYMSPEQATGERGIDGRSDVYALGCVCYEMLSGQPPFFGDNVMALISQHVLAAPPRLIGAVGTTPDSVADAVARALSKDPADRFATAGAFAAALEAGLVADRAPTARDERLRVMELRSLARKTVLVVDFINISGDPGDDWLSTGIAETLGVDLKKVAEIRVVGADAATRRHLEAERARGPLDAQRLLDTGRSLGARWVVWGAFQKAGSRIRLTPQFGDTESGTVIGAEKIDGAMDDIFALQDRIVTSLAEVLRIRLTSDEVAEIERPETTDRTAYEYYAKGQRAFQLFGRESATVAGDCFRKALELDPNYALAHAGLGSLLMPRYIAYGKREDLDAAATALRRAIELDPAYGEPWALLAYMYTRQHRYADAIAAGREAIEREPAHHHGWYQLAVALTVRALETGVPRDLVDAVPPLLRARALNPRWHPTQTVLGALYLIRGQYGHAVTVMDEAVAIESARAGFVFLGSFVQRAAVHLNSGEPKLAHPLLQRAIATYPSMDHVYAEAMTAYARFVLGCVLERDGALDEAQAAFRAVCDLADANPHRLSIGAHWVKARCGLARVLHHLGRPGEAEQALCEAREMFETKSRFVWGWFFGAAEADIVYELASALATIGRDDEAVRMLGRAVELCWSDRQQLNHDPAFAVLRERESVAALAARASELVSLPPPVGRGGLPYGGADTS